MNPAQPPRLRGTPSESHPVVGEVKTDSGPVEIAPLIRVLTAVIFPRNRLKNRFAVASGAAFVLGVPGDPARFGRDELPLIRGSLIGMLTSLRDQKTGDERELIPTGS
jgi:hypothetical protein